MSVIDYISLTVAAVACVCAYKLSTAWAKAGDAFTKSQEAMTEACRAQKLAWEKDCEDEDDGEAWKRGWKLARN